MNENIKPKDRTPANTSQAIELTIAPEAEVLVVDDNVIHLKVICGLLGLSKIDAKTASSGKEAIETVQQNRFDIVFMDLRMPDMDGAETGAHIRSLGVDYKSLPIIALTANSLQEVKEILQTNVFNDYISKPIDLQRLNQILLYWLDPNKITGVLAEQNVESAAPSVFIKSIAQFGGIDVNIGLSRVSGREEMYWDNLEFFHKNLLSRFDAMCDHINGKNLGRFSIDAHSMKSALATIGAMQLSDIAARLETAANNNDMDLCLNIFPAFHKELTSLHMYLSDVFSSKEDASSGELYNTEYLLENIRTAISAAYDSNSELGLEIINLLLAYNLDAQITALLNEAFAAFDDFNYDQAKEVLAKVLEKVIHENY